MIRKSIAIVFALTMIFGAVSAQAQECEHGKKPAGCAGENPEVGKDKCIWSWDGVNWTLLEKDGAIVAQAVVPGCGKRSMAVRTAMAAKVPSCKEGACGCGGCPFGAEGVNFEVKNEAKALFVTATGPADKLAAFKATMEKKIDNAKTGEGCGCGGGGGGHGHGHGHDHGHKDKAEKKAGGCGGHKDKAVFKPGAEKKEGCGCGK